MKPNICTACGRVFFCQDVPRGCHYSFPNTNCKCPLCCAGVMDIANQEKWDRTDREYSICWKNMLVKEIFHGAWVQKRKDHGL